MDYVACFIFGFASCAFLAGGFFVAYRSRLETWMTTNSDEVQVFDNGDGTQTAVIQVS